MTIFGLNALAVYVFHEVVAVLFQIGGEGSLRSATYGPLRDALGPPNGALLYGLGHVLLSFVFAWVLWRKRWFLKI